jgi:membrane dipeptidase
MNVTADASSLHREALVIDSHNDSLVAHLRLGLSLAGGPMTRGRPESLVAFLSGVTRAWKNHLVYAESDAEVQLNWPKMRQGGIDAAFFAVDVTRAWKNHLVYALDAFGFCEAEVAEQGGQVVIARTAAEVEAAKEAGQLAVILAVENSEVLEGSLYALRALHRLGVRSLGLTHHPRARAADGCEEEEYGGGLTRFGRRLVALMNELGVVVDVSHLSERGFWDVLEVAERPILASHSNCRALCDHPRNLTDDQLWALAENGGVVGITFVPAFVDPEAPSLERLLDHLEHAIQVAGIDHAGLGSDFDGGGTVLTDAAGYPQITAGLLARGYTPDQVRQVLGANHLRVLRAAEK